MSYLLLVLLFLLILLISGIVWLHHHFKVPRLALSEKPADFGMSGSEVYFPTVHNKRLFAWWLPNKTPSETTVVLMHGWGSSATQLLPLAVPFYKAGYNVLLPDSRNHGHSESHGFSSMPRFAEDLQSALQWLHKTHPDQAGQTILAGHSVGAGASLLTASRRSDIGAVISISAFSHPYTMMQSYLQKWPIPNWLVSSILEYVQWMIGFRFDDIAPMNTAAKLDCPVLLVHGNADTTVPVSEAHVIYRNCHNEDCELIEIDDADHDSVDKIEQHGHELIAFLDQKFAVAS